MIFLDKLLDTKPRKDILTIFLDRFWFAPQDVLCRSLEANIWKLFTFTSPTLDIGIGDGGISDVIFHGKKPIDVGIDLDPSGLDLAKATGKYKKVLQASAENMPFKDKTFTTVVSNSTFEHIRHDAKSVKEVGRVLKKNGVFFLTVPSNYLPMYVLQFEKENAKEKLDILNKRLCHFHYHSLEEWRKIFRQAGMDIVFHSYYYPIQTTYIWYLLTKFSTKTIRGKEVWSYIGFGKLRKIIPINLVKHLLKTIILKSAYTNGLFVKEEGQKGAMHFIIGQKMS